MTAENENNWVALCMCSFPCLCYNRNGCLGSDSQGVSP